MGDCQTELPYLSITAEAWRGFHALGPVWVAVGRGAARRDVVAHGEELLAVAPPLLLTLT